VNELGQDEQVAPRSSRAHEEIKLLELLQLPLQYKRLIFGSALTAALLAGGISMLLPNVYRAEVLLVPAQSENSKNGNLGSMLGGLGGLASMAGVSLGGGGSADESLAVLQSREFLWKFVQEKHLLSVLFERSRMDEWFDVEVAQRGQWDVYRLFISSGKLSVTRDKDTGIVTMALDWKDPALAARWANELVASLNQYLAEQAIGRSERNLHYLNEELMRTPVEEMRKTIFDLIASEQKNAMVANTQKDFAFKVLDPAVTPDRKAKPKRLLIVILAAFIGGFLAVFYIYIKDGIRRSREEGAICDPTLLR